MFTDIWMQFGAAATAFLIALAVGVIADQILYRTVNSRAARAGWAAGRELAIGLHGLPSVAGAIVGAFLALRRLDLAPGLRADISKGITILGIVVATAFGARILGRMVRIYTQRAGSRLPSTSIFVNLARGLVWVLGAMSVLAALGVSIAPLLTALGVVGLAVGLALQPTLENVFSGVQMLASRQIEPGDYIRLQTGEEGIVLDVTWRNTTVRRPGNEIVIVPNSVIGRSLITNFSTGGTEYSLTVPVSVALGTDLDVVERIALETAREVIASVDGAVRDAEPSVRFADLTPPTVTFNATMRVVSYPQRALVRSEFVRRLQRRLAEEGVEAAAAAPVAPASPAS